LPDHPSIVANPNCSTIQIVMAVAPLHEIFELRQLHVATYQSVSGAGAEARLALLKQLDERRPQSPESNLGTTDGGPFARSVAFDAVPEIGPPQEDGSFEEEIKVERESRKILGLPDLHVTCLAVRVPSWNGHGAVVRAVFNRNVDRNAAIDRLMAFPGVTAAAGAHEYSTPNEVTGQDLVHVGRLRADPGDPKALTLWVAADNLLKGAALNALQIGDKIVASRFRSGGDF
jgi:aspartate-semialdehyde dehydrogenase